MATSLLSLPVSIEQIATTVRQMSRAEQQQLLALVPELQRGIDPPPTRTISPMSVRRTGQKLAAYRSFV